jgi:methionine sulfoxide reductase heme-binding subunit
MKTVAAWWMMLVLGSVPLLGLLYKIAFNHLGANPVESVHIYLGDWTLRLLCLSLAITPLKTTDTWKWLLSYRRMIGLYTFFYATLHVLSYLILDHALVWSMIWLDIKESSFIAMGLLAYLIITAMAITSTKLWQRRLRIHWKRLHRLVYFAAVAAVLHYAWQLKGNLAEPLMYALIVGLLLGFRVVVWWRKNR